MSLRRTLSATVTAPDGAPIQRAADGSVTVTVIASTADVDRYGDIVDQDSWRLDAYKSNPVILFGHNSWAPPVGKAVVRVEGGRLMADITFDASEENAMGRLMASQYAGGFMSAVSVGFRSYRQVARNQLPLDDARRGERGLVLYDNELLEISCVPIPANPKAVAQRGGMDGMMLRADGTPARVLEAAVGGLIEALAAVELDDDEDGNVCRLLVALHVGQLAAAAAYLGAGTDKDMRRTVGGLAQRAITTLGTLQDWRDTRAGMKPATESAPAESEAGDPPLPDDATPMRDEKAGEALVRTDNDGTARLDTAPVVEAAVKDALGFFRRGLSST